MAAAAIATITAAPMICGGENHQAAIEIKITGPDFGVRQVRVFGAMKRRHAGAADAIFIPQLRWHLGEQRFGNFHLRAPARAFVSRDGAELAIIRLAAQRTMRGIHDFGRLKFHCAVKISGRNWPMNWLGKRLSYDPVAGFSKATWPSAKVTFAFCEWRK